MKPAPFRYHAPRSVADAVGLLAERPGARLLSGGQSLMPMLNLRYVMPDDVIDLNRIDTLAGIAEEGGRVRIGGMTRQRDLERSPVVARHLPVMREALRWVGHIQTRNRGTIGGSLCHLDPAAELPAIAMLYDAEVSAISVRGERSIAMAEFPAFYMTPALEPDEALTAVTFTPWTGRTAFGFVEFSRRHGDFAVVSAACLLGYGPDGRIDRAALVLGGVGAAPLRLPDAEARLTGSRGTSEDFTEAAAFAERIEAMDDAHAGADYRRHLARVLTGRALAQAVARPAA
ncbi:xanthine dehydrogenase family protein subunit M [Azospirillum sp. RWY-5-1]|uniref:Xanthine dehydrogenase family protein subunit M n=1 Tax=Azospirillum oleiclasticum TaxID=2735135 RepID=A0ABX2T9W0_9PROT|nr:xanthine dehydrogenase family protein subunit M [Azospirillum oleiclasticum]NYZ13699.1 xanthine dehydrogenase family protein subunit M [Azospirillum oleiclasticum]NYZ20971.1 xanthine dehydrogenase family protein subunit M [Azospirillum oleiclasticum]